ncbi:type I inositol 1,4,5-trisphosphate 5-phosphatase CVP2 [Pyrus ussuriensis x Pyrus communis]|uniref:Type I inositol 1,4,5-trisphosphate 5-phosphatase CVP2 n=1 Tax=Pyrus ussuriensis x Pyrus communis TaxID=2448454 RepID=A0A5N5GWW3_9ROSA|nr:type I inositol 1,4,5-trisphosphate 5-phosphatase CVP2 [Pyrus ussuriensis x Pyrus communis]KAB2620109.1 type I inositol 1,4,5-trisphosphate 5-phosphatase CVP2 [Pyrus ussuriensis x Pyrus communis]
MWPRLVANKILRKQLGSNNFVADFPSNEVSEELILETPSVDQPSSNLTSTVFNHHKDTNTHKYKVFVSTWNVGGVEPQEDMNMEDWIDTSSDIYVLGFQEIVPLKASNVLGSENSKICMKWNSLIREALNKKRHNNINNPPDFHCIVSKQMVGILISVWIRSNLRPFIRNPSVSCVGCGIMGCLGNKGSVSVRFRLHETSFCFVCTHLASGGREGDKKLRNSNISDIFSRTSFPRGPLLDLPQRILDHDRVIFLGDLNYRISLPEATTRSLVDIRAWNILLKHDQLMMQLKEGQVLEGWNEGAVEFAPTYKYCPNSDVYYGCPPGKKGEKRRAPAWCDRIIWRGEGLKQHVYSRGESKLSDHRPVNAIFTAEVGVLRTLRGYHSFFLSDKLDRVSSKFQVSSTHNFVWKGRSTSLKL